MDGTPSLMCLDVLQAAHKTNTTQTSAERQRFRGQLPLASISWEVGRAVTRGGRADAEPMPTPTE